MPPLATVPIHLCDRLLPHYAGRRMRAFRRLLSCTVLYGGPDWPTRVRICFREGGGPTVILPLEATCADALRELTADPAATVYTGALLLREESAELPQHITEIAGLRQCPDRNAALSYALQDLADEIQEDIREACFGRDAPDCWFPGVEGGIEPVADDHVALVIAGMQRELDRERRDIQGRNYTTNPLPPFPLASLPWRVQRALAERRRLRYAQWGIGREQWLSGLWSLWDVPEDADWLPRRQAHA